MLICQPAIRGCSFGQRVPRRVSLRGRETSTLSNNHRETASRDALHSKTFTLLNKTEGLLPKVFEGQPNRGRLLQDALDRCYRDVSVLDVERKRRIMGEWTWLTKTRCRFNRAFTVVGRGSGRISLVNALVDDGFTLPDAERTALRERWKRAGSSRKAVILRWDLPFQANFRYLSTSPVMKVNISRKMQIQE
jgi:hypothetical protein